MLDRSRPEEGNVTTLRTHAAAESESSKEWRKQTESAHSDTCHCERCRRD